MVALLMMSVVLILFMSALMMRSAAVDFLWLLMTLNAAPLITAGSLLITVANAAPLITAALLLMFVAASF